MNQFVKYFVVVLLRDLFKLTQSWAIKFDEHHVIHGCRPHFLQFKSHFLAGFEFTLNWVHPQLGANFQ